MKIFKGHLIRRKLMLLVAISILPSLFIILYSGYSQRNQVISQFQKQILNLSLSIRDLQSEKAERARLLLATLRGLEAVREQSYSECNLIFEQILRDNPELANVVFADNSGIVRASGRPLTEMIDMSDRKVFQDSISNSNFSAGEFVFGRIANLPIFQFGLPVLKSNGEAAGVISISYDLNYLGKFLNNIHLPARSRTLLVDSKGARLYVYAPDTDPPQIGTKLRKENWEIMSSSAKEEDTFIGIRSDKIECFFSFSKLRLNAASAPYMYVQVNMPTESILEDANSTIRNSLVLLGLASVMAFVIAKVAGNVSIVHEYNIVASSNAYNRSLIEASLDPLVAIDSGGKITDVNKATVLATGRTRNQLIGTDFALYFTNPDKAQAGYQAVFRDGFVKDYELELIISSHTSTPVLYNASVYKDEYGKILGVFAAARDITERKRSEELRMDIEHIVQHDLRAPASSAVIVSKLLADSPGISASDRDLLIMLSHSGQRMLDTLNQSLDLYKINAGQYQAVLKTFDMMGLIQEISDSLLLLPISQGKNVDITFSHSSCPSDSMCSVLADFNLTRLSLQNIIQNALEASQGENKVLIDLLCNGVCKISIRNSGVVPKEIRDRFFEKYVTAGKKFGTGIGTYSAKLMIEAQGGTIQMETSDERNETLVTIILPERHAKSI